MPTFNVVVSRVKNVAHWVLNEYLCYVLLVHFLYTVNYSLVQIFNMYVKSAIALGQVTHTVEEITE